MLTIYKASAGSGKTYTLVFEYIKLLLGRRLEDGRYVLNHERYLNGAGVDRRAHAHVLAITFTNKATAEMKERIIKELQSLTVMPPAGAKDAEYAAGLIDTFGCTRAELRAVAERSLRALLNDYGQFNVSTIDAFFQTILRSFAREIDRQGDFRLELDENTVISQAISLLFDEVNNDATTPEARAVTMWLDEMASDRMTEGSDFNPFNRTSNMYGEIVASLEKAFSEDFVARQQEMDSYLSDPTRLVDLRGWLRNRSTEIGRRQKAAAEAILGMVQPDTLNSYVCKLLQDVAAVGALSKKKVSDLSKKMPGYLQKLIDREPKGLFKGKATAPESVYNAIYDWAEALMPNEMELMVLKEMFDKTNTLLALAFIYRYIDRYRQENNLIVLADTNSLLGAIITESDTPFIYERVGVELEHFLIDEFQDTSRLQWRNLRPLVSNSLSSEHDNLIIGDVKQSIYRWRGGDPNLLATEVAEVDFPTVMQVRGDRPGENTNYRSAHTLVRFNNTLFHNIAGRYKVPGYEGVAQTPGKNLAGVDGLVAIYNLQGDALEATAQRYVSPAGLDAVVAESPDGVLRAKDVAYRLLGETITEQHKRGYRYDEIAILCRTHKNATEIAEALQRDFPAIPLVSDEALKLRNSQAVKLIISILEIIDKSYGGTADMDDAISYINREMPQLPDEEEERRLRRYVSRRRRAMLIDSFNYYLAHGHTVEEALPLALERARQAVPTEEPAADDNDLIADLAYIRKLAPSNLCALVEAIIDLKLTPEQRSEELPYITAFVDLVTQYTADYLPSIHAFLNYWREKSYKFAIPAGENQDGVTIMTVHKAKGLEWPCVHIPAMNWQFEASAENQWFDMDCMGAIPADIRPPMMYLTPNAGFGADNCPLRPQMEQRRAEQMADNLNVAYVAFTRAVRELHVTLVKPDKAGGGLLMAEAVSDAISSPDEAADTGIYASLSAHVDDTGSYVEGSPTVPVRKGGSGVGASLKWPVPEFDVSFNPTNTQLTRLADMTVMDETDDDPELGNTASREIVDAPADPVMEAAARHGLILHSILAQMYTIDDLDKAIEYHRRDIGGEDLELYRREIAQAFELGGSEPQRWFAPDVRRVLNEQAIYNAESRTNHRADRIVWTADGDVEVIDYKFTTAPRASHYEQVRGYAAMLETMGHKDVRAWLWYPDLGKVIRAK